MATDKKKDHRATNGRDPKSRSRKKLEIEERRATVAGLMQAHVSYREMSDALGVSLGTISGDVKAIRKQWMAAASVGIEATVAQELATARADERELRQMFAAEGNRTRKLAIWDRVQRLRTYRAELQAVNAEQYLRMLAKKEAGGDDAVLVVGGSEESFVGALRAATGHDPGVTLKAVE